MRTATTLARLALTLLLLAGTATAAPTPRFPCDGAPLPPWPATPGKLELAIWQDGKLPADWQPPGCSDWPAQDASVLMAAVGRLREPGGQAALLTRLGQVSALAGLRYWSVTRDRWTTLIEQAHAVITPDPEARRPDFEPDELQPGAELLYWQQEPTTSGSAVYALDVLERRPDRLLVSVRNATPSRYLRITMLDAGRARTLYLFQHLDGEDWGYYQLTRLGHGRHEWLPVTRASYANRAIAVFRWFAGLPEDAMPVWRD